jgi:uncharacterized protein YbjT (DUF2867 family)
MVGTTLITGATGTVGSEVAKQLSLAGQRVRAAVHSTTRASHETIRYHWPRSTILLSSG